MAHKAESLNDLGNELLDRGRLDDAAAAFARAGRAAPWWHVPWYNLALVHKRQGNWAQAVKYGRRAVLADRRDRDSWWNLGIAATALSDWKLARKAWTACGLTLPAGKGDPAGDWGPVPIRLYHAEGAEVVWAQRIDPARAVIRSVPLPLCGHHEGDLVLHDGAANGYRVLHGRQIPVFDALQVLWRSPRRTWEASVEAGDAEQLEALLDLALESGVVAEDWSALRHLCRACSEGIPHETHDAPPAEWVPLRRIGLSAAQPGEATSVLERWAAAAQGRHFVGLRLAAPG